MRRMLMVAAAAAGFALAAVTGMAVAGTTRDTVKTAHNAQLGETILVGGNGMTLYVLSPETTHHLLCTSKLCLQFWPVLKVRSAHTKLHKAPGVDGRLGIIHRHGFFQVTDNGRPLYFFKEDTATGQANGQNIKNFGGRWHVLKESSSSKGTNTTPSSTTTTNPYGY
jgi:predicted lipoprotein with Yx(FWY)xxD motif